MHRAIDEIPQIRWLVSLRLRSDRARLDSIANAYNRLRDSLSTAPGCVCQTPAPAPEPMKVQKDNGTPVKPEPIKTKKDKPEEL